VPVDGWPGEASKSARKRHARAARRAAASGSVVTSHLEAFGLHSNILDRALLKSPAFDRRREPRHAAIVLTTSERDAVRHLGRQAANCGSYWMAFRGYDTSSAVDKELRLACQARCGTRGCADCAQRIREREAYRVQGEWALFLTFTFPRERASAADAWREVHGWISTLVRELRREVAWANDVEPRLPGRRHNNHVDRWLLANERIQAGEKLEYAWVLEPHEDGYPHVHMCVNARWIDYGFLRRLWEAACGSLGAWIYGERVTAPDGVCRYLAKYIAKSRLTPDVLGIVFGRRLWATTNKREEKPEPRWIRESKDEEKNARMDAESGDEWSPDEGWRLVLGRRGAYALWERELPERQEIVVLYEAGQEGVRGSSEDTAAAVGSGQNDSSSIIELIEAYLDSLKSADPPADGCLTLA